MQTLDIDSLEIVWSLDDTGPCAVFVRGHLDADNDQIRHLMLTWAEHNYDIETDDLEIAKHVKQERWRRVPMKRSLGFDTRYVRVASGPGSFPVTVLDLREWV